MNVTGSLFKRWKPIWEDVRYIFVAVLTEAEEEKISSHGLSNWICNIKPNTTIEDINVATLKKSFPEIFKVSSPLFIIIFIEEARPSCFTFSCYRNSALETWLHF